MSFSEGFSLKNEVSSETIESIAEEDYNKNEDVFEVYLSEYYNEKDQPLVRSILKEMEYEFLCFLFEKEKIDLENFQNLNTNFNMTLLNQYPIGFIVKFNQAYEKWKLKHELNVNSCILQKSDLPSINSLLRESVQRKKFLAKIDHDQPMSLIERNELISIIVSSILSKRNNILKNEIRNLASMIISEFPNEDISSYINETTGFGNLYYKFNNEKKALKNNGSSTVLRKRKHKEITLETTEESFDEQEILSNDFLKSILANIDYNSLIDHWKKSSKIRLQIFKEASQKTDLAKIYRALERPDGYMLVS
ncbi:hypothetical protein PVAND_006909 [Polypedilum vanderplanki]|uniref:Uncharacterized protein n=1 Tax=Polypedilum vanderplanki TaxID=319348 RepID=A0A9J6C567_POLVA|nr:hypothetical protein PVAND_006909 [Polypedilum vanderplanki]